MSNDDALDFAYDLLKKKGVLLIYQLSESMPDEQLKYIYNTLLRCDLFTTEEEPFARKGFTTKFIYKDSVGAILGENSLSEYLHKIEVSKRKKENDSFLSSEKLWYETSSAKKMWEDYPKNKRRETKMLIWTIINTIGLLLLALLGLYLQYYKK